MIATATAGGCIACTLIWSADMLSLPGCVLWLVWCLVVWWGVPGGDKRQSQPIKDKIPAHPKADYPGGLAECKA